MSLTLLLAVLGLLGTLGGAAAALQAQKHTRDANKLAVQLAKEAAERDKSRDQIAILTELRELRTKVEAVPGNMGMVAKAIMSDLMEPLRKLSYELQSHMGVVDGKLELAFSSLEGLANDVAEFVMHHPDETRERFDYLLDHYRSKTLTADEELELRRNLDAVMKCKKSSAA